MEDRVRDGKVLHDHIFGYTVLKDILETGKKSFYELDNG